MRDIKEFWCPPIKFGWNNETITMGPELEVSDTLAVIVDKDGDKHNFLFEGYWSCESIFSDWTPWVLDTETQTNYHLERNEYIKVESGKLIPRCNIKHVVLHKKNVRKEQPTFELRGIKNWTGCDFFFVFAPVVVLSSLVALTIGAILYKVLS